MILYLSIFLAIALIYVFSIGTDTARSKWLLFAIMLFLGLFVGISDMLGGYDRYIYGNLFDSMCDDLNSGYSFWNTTLFTMYPSEVGYDGINYLIGFVSHNRYIFILIYTMLIYALLFQSIKKYTENYPFAVLVFMGLWFFFTFTYLRQVLAAATCWLAIDYVVQRKPLQFFAIVALAVTIHNSAIVFAPLYFVPIKKFSPVTVILIMVACLAVGLTSLPAGLFEQYGEFTDMEKRVARLEDFSSMNIRIEYMLEAVVFLAIIFWRYSDVDDEDEQMVTLTNMALIFCAILLIFVRSDNGGRLGWYYMMGVIATLTNLASIERSKIIYQIGVLIMMGGMYFRVLTSWGENGYQILYPYKTLLTNGVRDPDKCHEIYEYDNNYDVNKFYR